MPRNTSGSGEVSLQVLTQNAYSSITQKQKSSMFLASTKKTFFGQRSKKARQKKKTSMSDFLSTDTPTEEPQKPNSGP